MAWSVSKIFAAYIVDVLGNTTAMDLNTDASIKVALYNNTAAPDQLVTSANSAYGAGVWASNGVSDATGWPAAGNALASVTLTDYTTASVKFDAADLASADAHTDLANVYGCLVYDDTITTPVADQGICFTYLGGANSVVSGTFTIVWAATGIMALAI
jgi:hypothetical protein